MRELKIVGLLMLGLLASNAPGQEMEPAMDLPAQNSLPATAAGETVLPARPTRSAFVREQIVNLSTATGQRVRTVTSRAATAASPRRALDQARTNYREGRFYSTDYSEHRTPRAAMAHSIKPLDVRANVRASIRGNTSPINLVGALIGPASMELNRELATDGHISVSKLARAFEPGAIVGGLTAGVAADVVGAATQSALSGMMGPVGPVAGFLARPIIGYSAFLIGSNFGRGVQHGKPSLKVAFADSLRQIDPARDTGALVGGSIGAVVGQALIPVPILGGIVGGTVGGMVGSAVGNWIGHHGVTGRADQAAVRWLGRRADGLEGKGKQKTAPADKPASPEPPAETAAPTAFSPLAALSSHVPAPVPSPTPESVGPLALAP